MMAVNKCLSSPFIFLRCLQKQALHSASGQCNFSHTCKRLSSSAQPALVTNFVPESKPVSDDDVDRLADFLSNCERLFVLTGAGLSTESGIPDYRSEGVGLYARSNSRPIQHHEFVKSSVRRQQYWARNFVGWPRFSSFEPNVSHLVLSDWERQGLVHCLVTQNVDALHTKAGSRGVHELHGCSHRVMCLQCKEITPRMELQHRFSQMNLGFRVESVDIAPDGDVLLTQEQMDGFEVPACRSCGGVLKPDITFFGDNVNRDKVDYIYEQVDECDSLLVAGSSLMVFSGYRFVNRAAEQGKPIAILNIGATRADKLASLKIETRCGEILPLIQL